VSTVKVRLYRARHRLKTILLEQHPEIIPQEQRRGKMVKVTIADVVKQERTDEQGHPYAPYVIILQDEAGRRALPIWVGPFEGQSIATGLSEFATPRPMTFNFFTSLLQTINARVEQVRIETLKKGTFYAIVKIRCGKTSHEIDARPSDALALAVRIGSPVFVAEDVLQDAGADIPQAAKISPVRHGVEGILKEIEEMQRRAKAQSSQPMSQEELAKAREELIAVVFQ
jgi:bifunctional DNase/RNase